MDISEEQYNELLDMLQKQRTTLKVKKLRPDAHIPTKSPADLGYDFKVVADADFKDDGNGNKSYWLMHKETRKFSTGISLELPPNYGMLLKTRSGMASKGILVGGGVIDQGYRGEIIVVLTNLAGTGYMVKEGDKICQGVLTEVLHLETEEATELNLSNRQDAGFGSSGR